MLAFLSPTVWTLYVCGEGDSRLVAPLRENTIIKRIAQKKLHKNIRQSKKQCGQIRF